MPHERSYHLPDVLFALPEAEKHRSKVRGDLASFDNLRFFVRCILPLSVEHYGSWCVGLWVEVSKSDFDTIGAAWDDSAAYPTLRFSGTLANDVESDLSLPIGKACSVQLHTPHFDSPPFIDVERSPALGAHFLKNWPRGAFEEYARALGFL